MHSATQSEQQMVAMQLIMVQATFSLLTLTPLLAKMSFSKRRRVDIECSVWTASHLFTEINGKPVCLVCNQQVSVVSSAVGSIMRLIVVENTTFCKDN